MVVITTQIFYMKASLTTKALGTHRALGWTQI